MKQYLFFIFVFHCVLTIYAQNDLKTVIVSTYNYKLLPQERKLSKENNEIHYLISTYNKNSDITLTEKKDFSSAMTEAFPEKNILLFVHGDDFDIEKLSMISADFPELYNVNTILFAWDSYKCYNNSIKNYNNSKKNIDFCFPKFIQLIDSIKFYAIKNNVKVSVIFHSLGNIFAQKYSLYLESNPDVQQIFTNIIINSACIPTQNHDLWVDILCQKSLNNVYISINKNDKILKLVSIFIEHKKMLGKNCGHKISKNAHYIDFTDILKNVSNNKKMPSCHTYFISYPPRENIEIKKFYSSLFNSIVFCKNVIK